MRSLESKVSERCVRLLRNSLASDRVDKFVGRDRPESCTRDDRCSRLAGRDSPTQIDQLNELKSRTHRGLQDLTWLTRSWCCWVGLRWPGPMGTAFKRKPPSGSYFWPSGGTVGAHVLCNHNVHSSTVLAGSGSRATKLVTPPVTSVALNTGKVLSNNIFIDVTCVGESCAYMVL